MVFQDGGGYVKRRRELARAGRVRQPDPQGRDAGHGRHLRQPRRRAGGLRSGAAALQPQPRIRQRGRPLRALPARGAPARGGEVAEPGRRTATAARSPARARAAICAFTAAWDRPDAFSRVFSTIGTYVGLRGGHAYPTLVRKTEPKPLRVFLQDGSNDLNIYGGNWWLANQEMLSALEFAGYDVKHVWGDGAHDGKHGGAILPDALRWLWRDYPAPVGPAGPSKQPLLVEHPAAGRGLAGGRRGRGAARGDGPAGDVVFADGERLMKRAADGSARPSTGSARRRAGSRVRTRRAALRRAAGAATHRGLGRQRRETRVADRASVRAPRGGPRRRDLRDRDGHASRHPPVWSARGALTRDASAIARPSGLTLSPDQSLLLVADATSPFASSFQVQPAGPRVRAALLPPAPRRGRHRERGARASRWTRTATCTCRAARDPGLRPGRPRERHHRAARPPAVPSRARLRRAASGTSSSWPWAAGCSSARRGPAASRPSRLR